MSLTGDRLGCSGPKLWWNWSNAPAREVQAAYLQLQAIATTPPA
jgi:hypothetical protein